MARFLPRLAALIVLALAGAAASSQGPPPGGGAPMGTPGGNAPPGGSTAGVTGNTPGMADQVDEMNRRINGERQHSSRSASANANRARPATAAEVIAGAAVNDTAGVQLGTIESVDTNGAVIVTAVGRALIPMEAFGKNSHGLLLQTTKAQFDAQVAQANATPS